MSRLQLNLLPDIKLKSIKQNRTRNSVISVAILVSVICIALFLIMLTTVDGVQKKQMSDSDKALATATSQLQNISDLNKKLTIQNQLNSLNTLQHDKNITSRLFGFLTELTPDNVFINHVSLDLSAYTIQIDGSADSQHSVNVFIDTLKFATYHYGSAAAKPALTNVIESSFGLNSGSASFSVSMKFDPLLFSNKQIDKNGNIMRPTLSVPNQSTSGANSALFNGKTP